MNTSNRLQSLTSAGQRRARRWTRGSSIILAGAISFMAGAGDAPNETASGSPAKTTKEAAKTANTSTRNPNDSGTPKPRGGANPAGSEARVALTATRSNANTGLATDRSIQSAATASLSEIPAEETPIARAIRVISECQERFRTVDDYTCTFYKRERIHGKLTPQFVMLMKERTKPKSIYFRFQQPNRGREAIFVHGRNGGRVLAHDVGLNRLLAGTLELEPTSARAMENCRHPITEAGIGNLIETVARRWKSELSPDHSSLAFDSDMMIGPRRCLLVESVHPERRANFLFHKVRLFIDSDLGLPIRFEGYDWPKEPGADCELVEEYSYINLELNTGLTETDFDPANEKYQFGRF